MTIMANQYEDKIKAALLQLDPSNAEHWTEDGLPVTRVVQQLASEPNLKRSDINEVAPGFTRETTEPVEKTATGEKADAVVEPVAQAGETKDSGVDYKAAYSQAEAEYAATKRDTVEARRREDAARAAMDAARVKMNAAFPPMSHAENIQQYLKNENAVRAAKHNAAGVYASTSQIDLAMSSRRGRGWNRPQRGQVVKSA
jgi:hypothetical protein